MKLIRITAFLFTLLLSLVACNGLAKNNANDVQSLASDPRTVSVISIPIITNCTDGFECLKVGTYPGSNFGGFVSASVSAAAEWAQWGEPYGDNAYLSGSIIAMSVCTSYRNSSEPWATVTLSVGNNKFTGSGTLCVYPTSISPTDSISITGDEGGGIYGAATQGATQNGMYNAIQITFVAI